MLVALVGCADDSDGNGAADAGGDGGPLVDTALDVATDGADGTTADTGPDAVADASADGAGDTGGGEDAAGDVPVVLAFAAPGPIAAPSGKGSFTFGVSTAATQIEDSNPDTDWYLWTAPPPDGLGNGEDFVGEASMGYTKALDDIDLVVELGVDVYRLSIEWARVEPERDAISEEALAHYDAVIDELLARGIRPMITLHHFSNPVWVHDPLDPDCKNGPGDTNLCGFGHPAGGALVIEEMREHAALVAARYGDRVDMWATLNEPINYLLLAYGVGFFPPGKAMLLADLPGFIAVARDYAAAHVAMYDALKDEDTLDADGDGEAAAVGYTAAVGAWVPARNNQPSDDPEDVAAAGRVRATYNYLFTDSFVDGGFDSDLDGTLDEVHPDWAGKLDWLGVQYYFRAGVTAEPALIPGLDVTVCIQDFDFGSCLPPADETHVIPDMGYEYWEEGIYEILKDFSVRWPALPMTVTESGLATNTGRRRAEHVVRSLEQIHRAMTEGVDVRGYYHWSLFDNFEWVEGYKPRFGLYRVDYETYERTPTEGATVLEAITGRRGMTQPQLDLYGGTGPMTPEAVQ